MTKLSPESSMLSFLQSIPLLSHIQLERLATLAGHLTSSHEKFGTVLMREGENTENITIIWNGTVSVERKVLNATTCEEARILSSCMRTTAQTKILKLAAGSEDDEAPSRATPSQASLVTGTCGRGVIFGELSVLFGLGTSETVRVESVTGAHILRCPAAAIHECCEDKALVIMKAKVQQVARWRQEQASVISGSMTAAAYHYSTRPETHVAFPSSREIKSINRKARADVWHPLGWRKKLAQQEELERTAAEVAMREKSGKELKKAKRNAPPRRPSSALAGTSSRRGVSRHAKIHAVVGAENIGDRNLFLASWEPPEQHHVHLGSGVRGDSSAAEGFHLELDVDAIRDLDGTYLASFQ